MKVMFVIPEVGKGNVLHSWEWVKGMYAFPGVDDGDDICHSIGNVFVNYTLNHISN